MPTKRLPVPTRRLISADMQATKAIFGMLLACHSVWCWCTQDTQHLTPIKAYETLSEIVAWYARAGCRLKTLKDMCMLAHYSYGILMGGAFTKVHCTLCG